MQRAQVRSLVRDLRAHIPCRGQTTNTDNRKVDPVNLLPKKKFLSLLVFNRDQNYSPGDIWKRVETFLVAISQGDPPDIWRAGSKILSILQYMKE